MVQNDPDIRIDPELKLGPIVYPDRVCRSVWQEQRGPAGVLGQRAGEPRDPRQVDGPGHPEHRELAQRLNGSPGCACERGRTAPVGTVSAG